MRIKQNGFSLVYAILGLVVLAGIAGGFYVVRNRESSQQIVENYVTDTVAETTANGTAGNAVKAVSEQIFSETLAEEAAMKIEEKSSEFSDSAIDELKEVANESNL